MKAGQSQPREFLGQENLHKNISFSGRKKPLKKAGLGEKWGKKFLSQTFLVETRQELKKSA